MSLPSKNFDSFIADLTLAWQNAIGLIPALQQGDLLLAIMQAFASQLLFIQSLVQLVNNIARAQTSTGADLDSFMAQFGFPRLQATFLQGPETFSRTGATTTQVLVYPGTLVQTPGGAIQYKVIGDTTQSAWNATLGAYVLSPGQTSMTCTVQALVAGTAYSVTPGQLSQLATAVAGINTVANASAINSASPAETDDAYRARFVLYLASLSKATKAAILYAINSTQTGLFTNLLENETPTGMTQLGAFTAVVDDGSGNPSSSLLNQIFAAVDAARGFTIQPYVVGPTIIVPAIAFNIRATAAYQTSNPGFTPTDAENNAIAAVLLYLNSLEPGAGTIFISGIEEAALQAVGVQAIQPGQTKINGTAADLIMTAFQAPRVTSSNFTVGQY